MTLPSLLLVMVQKKKLHFLSLVTSHPTPPMVLNAMYQPRKEISFFFLSKHLLEPGGAVYIAFPPPPPSMK